MQCIAWFYIKDLVHLVHSSFLFTAPLMQFIASYLYINSDQANTNERHAFFAGNLQTLDLEVPDLVSEASNPKILDFWHPEAKADTSWAGLDARKGGQKWLPKVVPTFWHF